MFESIEVVVTRILRIQKKEPKGNPSAFGYTPPELCIHTTHPTKPNQVIILPLKEIWQL